MDEERAVEEIITKFLLNTSRLRPQLSVPVVEAAAACCALVATTRPDDDAEAHYIPLITGSVAEFFIEPMLPHLGDVDVMFHLSTELAIPRGQSPPTQLPAEFHNYAKVLEIIDSHLPGYVYLELRYLLTVCNDEAKYNAVECDMERWNLSNRCYQDDGDNIHGPAMLTTVPHVGLISTDNVYCVRCLSWPPQAADWPIRHRNHGWPDSATVDHVVNNGCDVVPVAHRQCRQHEWMGKNQWRLSFSRAEIVLINSWTPVQQIVYHMLRVFVKTERLTDNADSSGAGKLSNYHVKTLMLWASERKSKSWWTDDLNLVRICVGLLHILGEWLTVAWCPHYFINNYCNLTDNSFSMTHITSQLMSMDERWLSTWFIDSYIRKCSQLCPEYISRLFDDVSTSMKLQKAVSATVAWRLNSSVLNCWHAFVYAEYCIATCVYHAMTERPGVYWINELTKIDSRLCDYFTAVIFLRVASKLLIHDVNGESIDILSTILGQLNAIRHYSNNSNSSLSLNKAANLMKVVTNNSRSRPTVQLIEIELSKAYLHRALRCKDSDSDSIYCLANVYLAALYYTTGEYQTAIDHCTLVMRSQDHSQCSSRVVQGELLPKIDDDIDVVLGLAVFYQHVRTSALNQKQQVHYVAVFTTELVAYHLNIKCRQFTQTLSLTYTLKLYEVCIINTPQLYIGDMLLFLSASRSLKHVKHISQRSQYSALYPIDNTASYLVELLQQSAVEHLTTYRQLEARDFGSVTTIVTTDFEAVYAYKRGDYQRCLQLSTQNVHTLLYADDMAHVLVFPEFIQLLDDDGIVSLIALILTVNPKCRHDTNHHSITQLTLTMYLMTECQLKLCHSVTSLAQTLDYIEVAQSRHPVDRTLDHLTLKLAERKIVTCLC